MEEEKNVSVDEEKPAPVEEEKIVPSEEEMAAPVEKRKRRRIVRTAYQRRESETIRNEHLRIFLVALIFGGVWGFLEATLGTIVHNLKEFGALFSTTAILLPVAWAMMGLAYKETHKARTLIYVGLVASALKLSAFFLPLAWAAGPRTAKLIVDPTMSILFEALVAAGVVAVLKPAKVISLKSVGVVLATDLIWPLFFLAYQAIKPFVGYGSDYVVLDAATGALSMNWDKFGPLLARVSWLANSYTIFFGGIIALCMLAFKKEDIANKEKAIDRVVFHKVGMPVTAAIVIAGSITTTLLITQFISLAPKH